MLASRRAILIPTMLVAAGTALSAVAAGPSLDVSPLISQADTPIHIRASGLQPGGLATISAVTRDGSGNHWRSSVTCKADAAGRVDLARCAPVHGSKSTYAIVDDMGLFWSMRQQDGDSTFFQFPAEPSAVYELALELHGKVVERMPIERRLMSDGVARVPLTKHDDGIVGTAFEPTWAPNARDPQSHARSGRYPAVIILGGSGGRHPWDALAALLASHGYETLSLAYYNGPGLPDDLVKTPIETVGKAIAWLEKRHGVDASRIAIVGHSRGSELALLSAAQFPEIKAAVALAGSPVAWPGINPHDYAHDVAAWTLGGKPVPTLSALKYFVEAYHAHKPPITAFEKALDNSRCGQNGVHPDRTHSWAGAFPGRRCGRDLAESAHGGNCNGLAQKPPSSVCR